MSQSEDPSKTIYERENFLSYLRESIEERKQTSRSFNMRRLAERAEISTSLLSLILSGKRNISLVAAEGLAKALTLRGRKRRYFLTLARLHNARTDEERWNIQNELVKIKESVKEDQLEIRQYRVISRWYYSAIYVLIGLKNIPQDPPSLLERLGRGLNIEMIEEALRDLETIDLIKKEGERFVQTRTALSTGIHNKEAAIYQYHHQMLKMAMMSLKLPHQRREIQGLSVGIPKSKLKTVKNKINDFISELNSYLSEFDEAEQVYQINMQLFELSDEKDSKK